MSASALTEAELLDQLPVGVLFVERRSIVRCNALLEQMLGYGAGELEGKPLRVLYRSEPAWPVPEAEAELMKRDGGVLPCRLLTRVHGPDAVVIVVFGREAEAYYARFLAYHDALTGLPNRRLLDDRLQQALAAAQRHERKVAALLADIDSFRQVNDALGRRAGDTALRELARRFGACLRRSDTLARNGPDEFTIVLVELQSDAACRAVAEKLLQAAREELRLEDRGFTLGASIGISIFPGDAGDAAALLRNAGAALERAKQLGRNRYCFYGR